jgi:hypothetical protein
MQKRKIVWKKEAPHVFHNEEPRVELSNQSKKFFDKAASRIVLILPSDFAKSLTGWTSNHTVYTASCCSEQVFSRQVFHISYQVLCFGKISAERPGEDGIDIDGQTGAHLRHLRA